MKIMHSKRFLRLAAVLLLSCSLFLGGCTNNMTPVNPTPGESPSKQYNENEFKVTYNYGDTGPVQLSNNNIVMKIGEKLILEPAPGLTKTTRFSSSGENYIGNTMEKNEEKDTGRVVFTATKPGKGKIQIIPNTTDLDRAVDLW
ncbi:MAG: hypothetical protein PHQ46_08295 [Negativicutes bacterium]|nr:hypothetical protein [Negativicutes bacterium]